ncbi:MAG: hypothetical protein IPO97_13495 [Sphingomonadales bacterium]|nr:hypothetical protein [Sphingomonadales bacterium]
MRPGPFGAGDVAHFERAPVVLLFPLIVAVVSLPLSLALRLVSSFIPLIGGFGSMTCLLFGALLTTIGDPIVYLVNRQCGRSCLTSRISNSSISTR